MREEISNAACAVLEARGVAIEGDIAISDEMKDRLTDLADVLAILRSEVARDGYKRTVAYIPEPEIGTRLVKQFVKLARGIAAVRGKHEVGEEEYAVIARIARDTLPSKRCATVRIIYELYEEGFVTSQQVGERLRLSTDTATEVLEDLWLLPAEARAVDRQGSGKFTWRMTEGFKRRLDAVGFFKG